MSLTFYNTDCRQNFLDCKLELENIRRIAKNRGPFDKEILYLSRYAIIISSASTEVICKTMIADYCEEGSNRQMKNYLNRNFREQPFNVRYDALCKQLKKFDDEWYKIFKKKLNKLSSSDQWKFDLDSLVGIRNDFAHGGRPTTSIESIISYYKHSIRVLLVLERAISSGSSK